MSDTKYVTKDEFDESMKLLQKKLKKINAPPRAPRKPNVYNNFVKDQMVEIKKENPGISSKMALTKCAEIWNKDKESKEKESKESKESKKVKE